MKAIPTSTLLFTMIMVLPAIPALCQETQDNAPSEERIARFFERYPEADANEDGTLTLDEIRAFNQKREPSAEQKARFLEQFPQADANQDGELTMEEIRLFNQQRQRQDEDRSESRPNRPTPTHADVAYGEHERQKFDLWLAESADGKPTPLVIYIHGGGFRAGSKNNVDVSALRTYLEAGISFASMGYRLSDEGPYPIMMHDAARGLQTIRARAEEWNLDARKIACYGGSAGAGISLWLAFHDDLANRESKDPIEHQSTRIVAAGTMNGQPTYDMRTYREWFGVPDLPLHTALFSFYDIETEEDLEKERVQQLMEDASPITHLDENDVPVYMVYGSGDTPVDENTGQGAWVHHVKLGLKLQEAMAPLGIECVVNSPEHPDETYGSMAQFFISKLTSKD